MQKLALVMHVVTFWMLQYTVEQRFSSVNQASVQHNLAWNYSHVMVWVVQCMWFGCGACQRFSSMEELMYTHLSMTFGLPNFTFMLLPY